ncbi:MAG: sugar phosphate isomerase/epimerase family protein [Burkholderiales bacterium]
MKTAFHLHAIRAHFEGTRPTDAEQASVFARIAAAGFDGIDIAESWDFAHWSSAGIAATRDRAREHGLAVATVSAMGRTLCHPELAETNLAALHRALDVADGLGARLLNVALAIPRVPGVTPIIGANVSPGGSLGASEADFDATASRLAQVARRAAARGIRIAVELHDRSLADASAPLLRIVEATGEPNVGTNPDLCNGYRAYAVPPESWQAALAALAPRAVLWHVNNLQRVHFPEIARSAFVERPLGEGDVDYRLAARTMRETGFDGWVVIEYKGTGDAFETIARGREYFARVWNDAGSTDTNRPVGDRRSGTSS